MAADPDFAPDPRDRPLGVDQRRRALDAHIFAAVHAFLLPYAVGLEHRPGLVRSERQFEAVLASELFVTFDGIGGYADDPRPRRRKLGAQAVEGNRLGGAALGVVLGIEIKNDLAPPQGAKT